MFPSTCQLPDCGVYERTTPTGRYLGETFRHADFADVGETEETDFYSEPGAWIPVTPSRYVLANFRDSHRQLRSTLSELRGACERSNVHVTVIGPCVTSALSVNPWPETILVSLDGNDDLALDNLLAQLPDHEVSSGFVRTRDHTYRIYRHFSLMDVVLDCFRVGCHVSNVVGKPFGTHLAWCALRDGATMGIPAPGLHVLLSYAATRGFSVLLPILDHEEPVSLEVYDEPPLENLPWTRGQRPDVDQDGNEFGTFHGENVSPRDLVLPKMPEEIYVLLVDGLDCPETPVNVQAARHARDRLREKQRQVRPYSDLWFLCSLRCVAAFFGDTFLVGSVEEVEDIAREIDRITKAYK